MWLKTNRPRRAMPGTALWLYTISVLCAYCQSEHLDECLIQFAETIKHVVDFAMNGEGDKLQERLQKRAKQRSDSSWLVEWWNDAAYLTDPEPLVFFVSYFYAFKDIVALMNPKPAAPRAQCAVAAALVFEALKFRDLITQSELLPETAGGRCVHPAFVHVGESRSVRTKVLSL
jgi:hypothetical protein